MMGPQGTGVAWGGDGGMGNGERKGREGKSGMDREGKG